ncbi:MAG: C39 family peptidase [Desulfobaccales bacterium]
MQPRTPIRLLLIIGCFLAVNAAVALAAEVDVRLGNDGTGVFQKKVTSWKAKRAEQMITQAYDYSCGAATLATVLRYQFGCPLTEKEAILGMARHGQWADIKKRGFSLLDMKLFCQSLHYQAQGYKVPDMDTLQKFPMPVITIIKTRLYNHFIVIRRVDDKYVYVSDPAWGNRKILRADFEENWPAKVVFAIAGPKQGKPEGLYCETNGPGISLYQVIRTQDPGNPIAMDPTRALVIGSQSPLVPPLSTYGIK